MLRLFSALFSNAYVLLFLTMLMWGGNGVAARLAVGQISPLALTSGRWLIVVAFIGLFLRRDLALALPILRKRWRYTLLMGSFGYTLFNVIFYISGHFTSAVNLTLLQGSIPAFVLLGAYLVYGTPVRGVQLIGIAVAMIGVVITASGGSFERLAALAFNLGDVLMVIACAFYAGYTVGLKDRPEVPGLGFFAAMAIVAAIVSIPFLAIEIGLGRVQWPGAAGMAVLAYVAIFPSFLAQLSFMRAVALIGPGRAGLFANLVPVLGAILAVGILGEPFGWHHAVSMVLVLGGIFIAERARPVPPPMPNA